MHRSIRRRVASCHRPSSSHRDVPRNWALVQKMEQEDQPRVERRIPSHPTSCRWTELVQLGRGPAGELVEQRAGVLVVHFAVQRQRMDLRQGVLRRE